jgi:hypothetical protein
LSPLVGELVIVDDEDERLVLTAEGSLRAQVVPEDADQEWRPLLSADELVEFYDPTDVFGDLADAVAEGWPEVAPEMARPASDEDVDATADPDETRADSDDDGEAADQRNGA